MHGIPGKLLSKLQRIQNASAKLIVGAKKRDHVTAILKELHWLPVDQRVVFKVLLLTYKALHDEVPVYLKELLHWHVPSRSLRSSSANLLVVPSSKLITYGDRFFHVAAPTLWNKLPLIVRNSSSCDVFKNNLKTHLFKIAYK